MTDDYITPDDLVHAIEHRIDDRPLDEEDYDDPRLLEAEALMATGIPFCVFFQMDGEHCLGEVQRYSHPIEGTPEIKRMIMGLCEAHVTGIGDPDGWTLVEED